MNFSDFKHVQRRTILQNARELEGGNKDSDNTVQGPHAEAEERIQAEGGATDQSPRDRTEAHTRHKRALRPEIGEGQSALSGTFGRSIAARTAEAGGKEEGDAVQEETHTAVYEEVGEETQQP